MTELTNYLGDGEIEAPKPEGPRRLPEDWYPSEELVTRCEKLGLVVKDPEFLISEFVDYWTKGKGKGKRRKDWDGTFINRMKQQRQYESNNRGKSNGQNSTQLIADNYAAAYSQPGAPIDWDAPIQ